MQKSETSHRPIVQKAILDLDAIAQYADANASAWSDDERRAWRSHARNIREIKTALVQSVPVAEPATK